MTTNQLPPGEVYAVDFAVLAREIAMDIFPIEQILAIHKLSDEEFARILAHPTFQKMQTAMQIDWNLASSTGERVRAKAATGLESQLEVYIAAIGDDSIPLTQRVEAGKFLARLGELDGQRSGFGASSGAGVIINITTSERKPTLTLTATPVIDVEP